MKKALLSLFVVAILGALVAYEGSSKTSTIASSTTTSKAVANPSVALKDGTFLGTSQTNRYDEIQVAITVKGGKITDVTTPVLTGHNGQSDEINSYATSILKSEALSSQGSQIDGVSGASYTTEAYVSSLQAAIDAAKA